MKLRLEDLTWREIDGDLVVLDLRTSTYLTANASGSVLMKHLTEERTLGELAELLVETFGIPGGQALLEARTFVDDLGERGLLDRTGEARPTDAVAASGGR